MIFKVGDIPNDWKIAHIYPIPKPTEWHFDITKTRPITLLETVRKAFAKILNNRLSKIISKHHILKGNNYAGLPGKSTQEPIKILNMIMEEAVEQKNEIWILFQDLSKAYDRVDLKFLKKALDRIKVPTPFTNMIINLFVNRKNSIFTNVGLTDQYDVKIGIDQGEVISPLLWVIYYDPLLCEIQNKKLGYIMKHSWKPNVLTNEEKYIEQEVPTIAFMDDTTWIAPNKNNLEQILEIADEFYIMTNTAINKDKSVMITNNKQTTQPIPIRFGDKTISIINSTEPVRFLGVWIKLSISKKHTIEQSKKEVKRFVSTVKRKPLTDKQMTYIVNMVLIPIITYRLQNTVLKEKECSEILAPIRRTIKNKLKFTSTTPNCMMHGRNFYNLADFWSIQLQRHSNYFLFLFGSDLLLYNTSKIRLLQLQSRLGVDKNILTNWKHQVDRKWQFNYIAIVASLLYTANGQLNINTNKDLNNHILGGQHTINSLLPIDTILKYGQSLFKHNIIFLEQLTTDDNNKLLTWKQIVTTNIFSHNNSRLSPRVPNIFKKIESIVINNSHRTIHSFLNTNNNLHKPLYLPFPKFNSRNKEFVAVWNPIINNMVCGNIFKKLNDNVSLIQHWVSTNPRNRTTNFLSKCSGCKLNNIFVQQDSQFISNLPISNCISFQYNNSMVKLKQQKTTTTYKPRGSFATNLPLEKIKEQVIYRYKYQKDIYQQNLKTPSYLPTNYKLIDQIIKEQQHQTTLKLITKNIEYNQYLEIYTDGSLISPLTPSCKMGIGWFVANINQQRVQFQASLKHFPSSTKAEIVAVLTALITCPPNSQVDLYLDSANTINTFTKVIIDESLTHKQILKITNCWIWLNIKYIIDTLQLKIHLHKVKAHSNNKLNDLADTLAKQGTSCLELNINIQQNIAIYLSLEDKILETPIHKFWKEYNNAKNFSHFLNLKRNEDYKQLTRDNLIDWKYILNTFNNNNEINTSSTSFEQSNSTAFKSRIFFKELPTVSHLSHKYHNLYGNLNCPTCDTYKEDQDHIWQCPNRNQDIADLHSTFNLALLEQCKMINKANNITTINEIIDSTDVLEFKFILQGLIPKTLTALLNSVTHSKEKTYTIINNCMKKLTKNIYEKIWKPRCNDMIAYEKHHNITKKLKKQKSTFRRNNRHNNTMCTDSTWDTWITLTTNHGGHWTDF